ncbi:ankyrin repeat domain-containing protein [Flavobacterium sp. RHBU_3]|uniref:ankyrin repeat domain-containing protein n=1 Tax=Flavobacterium sp. RHBU_3 TaxID=3391184 RepID=UPI0039854C9E
MKKAIVFAGLALALSFNAATAATITNNKSVKELRGEYGTNTPLAVAIVKGDVETVKKFIEYGADVNEQSSGLTPLMLAARYNQVDIIKLLLEAGARVKETDGKGYTALKYAQLSNAAEAITVLKQALAA